MKEHMHGPGRMPRQLPHLRLPAAIDFGPTRLNMPVLVAASLIIGAVTIWALVAPDHAAGVLATAVSWVTRWFGSFYIALATAILVFMLWLALSRYGMMRLGPDDSRPDYSFFSWAAMLFAAGIGTDILFFSVAEPVTHYIAPPTGDPYTDAAARAAVVWGLFHYGVTGWGMYALLGVALGYFAYRRQLPLAVRSALFPIFGRRMGGVAGHAVDTAAVIGTVFGVAASLGIGVVQLALGLSLLGIAQPGMGTQIGLVVLAIVMAAASATTGLDRGIRLLSQLNVILGIGLGLWILATGRTTFLIGAFVTNIGDYLSSFPGLTLDTMAYGDNLDWLQSWTLFFWAWWIAWASFVGMFLARISRGRTIRQFVLGSLIVPFIYVAMWINIFGDGAIDLIRAGDKGLAEAVAAAPERGIYYLLQAHPAATVTIAVAVLVGLLFYVTSADSGALVMTNLCSTLERPDADGPRTVRVYWAIVTGVVTIAMLAVGGIPALQSATIIMAVPFSVVLVLVMVGLYKAISTEGRARELRAQTYEYATPDPANRAIPWYDRLTSAVAAVDIEQARAAMAREVAPALEDIAARLQELGASAQVVGTNEPDLALPGIAGTTPSAEVDLRSDQEVVPAEANQVILRVGEAEDTFTYSVEIVLKASPGLAGYMVREGDKSARLEVQVSGNNCGYDIMGMTRAQVRHDVIENYERHLNFLAIHHAREAQRHPGREAKPGRA